METRYDIRQFFLGSTHSDVGPYPTRRAALEDCQRRMRGCPTLLHCEVWRTSPHFGPQVVSTYNRTLSLEELNNVR